MHCRLTEPCVEDVYCNCSCEKCNETICHRPGCSSDRCKKIHVGDQRWVNMKMRKVR